MNQMGKKSFVLPDVRKNPLGFITYFKPILMKKKQYIFPVLAGHFIFGTTVCYLQQEAYYNNVLPVLLTGRLPTRTPEENMEELTE